MVYSVGSRNEFDFEEGVFEHINSTCEIHTFDPGNFTKEANKAGVHYHMMRIGAQDEEKSNTRSIPSIIKELGHEGKTIDIFKIDCEGCEWDTVHTWFEFDANVTNVTIRQIQSEIHRAKIPETKHFFDVLYDNNYVITHKEPNIAFPLGSKEYAIEYAFLKLTDEFFEDIKKEKKHLLVDG